MSKIQFTERQLRPLVRAIERREAELRREIAEERERANVEGYAELVNHGGDAADQAFARIRAGIEEQRIDSHLAEIRELEAARERLDAGAFGACVQCHEFIDHARLKAFPGAARCAICQERLERAYPVHH
ncbi:MAG: TraR/DksA C4-type zinc finger protein [Betaproteobacteria bacterium]